jgi:hypothetical protein
MARRLVALGIFAVIAASGVTVALAGSSASIRLVSVQPLVIAGAHFKAHERVAVTAIVGTEQATKRATATRQGTFQVSFVQHLRIADPCGTNGRIRVLRSGGRTLTRTVQFSKLARGVACFMLGP